MSQKYQIAMHQMRFNMHQNLFSAGRRRSQISS